MLEPKSKIAWNGVDLVLVDRVVGGRRPSGGLADGLVGGRRPSGGLADSLVGGRRPSGGLADAPRQGRLRARHWLVLALGFVTAITLGTPARAATRTHTVSPGQTLAMIAKRYKVTLAALCTKNSLKPGARIKPGDKLVIPGPDDSDSLVGGRAPSGRLADGTEAPRLTGKSDHSKKGDQGAAPARTPPGARSAQTSAAAVARPQPAPKKSAAPAPAANPYAKKPPSRGLLTVTSFSGTWKGQPLARDGKVTTLGRKAFTKIAASHAGNRLQIDDRLIQLMVKTSDHFGGRTIHIVSGYRPFSPTQHTPHSRHNVGHAIDFSIEGVPNTVLRDYCRTLGTVGVGYYPHSSFVHLDVRELPTYWVDYSRPGEAPRYTAAESREPATIRTSAAVDALDHVEHAEPDTPAGSALTHQ